MNGDGLVVDTSALVAILLAEEGWRDFRDKLARASRVLISAANLLETRMVILSRLKSDGITELDIMIRQLGINIVPVDERLSNIAFDVHRRFGKGAGKPGALNFGDCFSLALSEAERLPLLFKGNDFSRCGAVSAL